MTENNKFSNKKEQTHVQQIGERRRDQNSIPSTSKLKPPPPPKQDKTKK